MNAAPLAIIVISVKEVRESEVALTWNMPAGRPDIDATAPHAPF